ncbi:uncharacterized protein LOC107469893 [Arachis duranensis]|uniref:Uncharacterized protein LOC107469893 n=1 Tax=Arachis duranensis TaxID=130453 RepID=A0A6P4BRU7_ARADU|nr:uncharacterized protein LOC107469893 [Arachis duranensis]
MNFVFLADELYWKGVDGSLSRCLSREDQNIALGEVHNGICGAHQAGKKIRWVLYRNYVYWPSMIKDCINYAKACQECQKHGSEPQVPAIELHSIIKTLLPLEVNLNTLRVLRQNELPVDDYWNAMFDELNELDSERILALENVIRQKESIAQSYNRRIKEKSFKIGELVLKVILPMEKKSKFLGKWSHNWEGPFQVIGTYSENAYQIQDIKSGKVINSINGKYLKPFYCWQT